MTRLLFMTLLLLSAQSAFAQWTCGDTLVDPRDGKMYITIAYGSDCWMAENLNYGQYTTSDTQAVIHSNMFNDGNVQKYGANNDSMNCVSYGGLYEWNELMNYNSSDPHGICPPGWHVATDAEWQAMIIASGGTFSGNRGTGANDLKALGEGVGADTGTNASGFGAKAHGDRDGYGIFYGLHMRSIFWTSSATSFMPYQYTLWAENDTIYRYNDAGLETGFSCRCVKDAPLGIEEPEGQMQMNIYPDPADSWFTINVPGNTQLLEFTVTDAQGKIVLDGQFTSADHKVNTTGLLAGFYVVSVCRNGEYFNRPLIITR